MPRVPLQHVVPPGGFHFVDQSGGQPVRIEGEGFDDVAARVLRHRLANGFPPGNPLQEVYDFVCGSWPHFCRDTDPSEIKPAAVQQGGGLATRVATWIARFVHFARSDAGVSPSETERRANICAGCPHNQEFRGGCGSCVDNIQRLFFVWRRDRLLPRENELRGCTIIGQHNGAAALAKDLPPIGSDVRDSLPAHCWRKAGE